MKLSSHVPTLALFWCALFVLGIPARVAQAQATKIFVASYGADANDGSRGSPKRNFQAAHDAVASGGQIVVLDTSGYGALNITKSLSITVPPGVNGFVTVTGTNNGITINAGSSGTVALRGLIVEGPGNGSDGYAVTVNSVGYLAIEGCTIRNFSAGIVFLNSNSSRLYLYDSVVRGCALGVTLQSFGNGVVSYATFKDSRLDQNSEDALLVSPGAGASVTANLADCVFSANTTGIESQGANALVRVSNCSITGNGTGVSASSGQLISRTSNTLENNGGGNAFPGTYSAK